VVLTFTLLALAIVLLWWGNVDTLEASPRHSRSNSSWLRSRHLWLVGGGASLISALATEVVTPIALLSIGGFGAAAYLFSRPALSPVVRAGAALAIVVLAAGLMLHRLPGFHNPRVIGPLRLSPDAIPFRFHLNYDKTLVGLMLLGWCHRRLSQAAEWRRMFRRAGPWAAVTIVTLIALSLIFGYVDLDPKLPSVTPLWIAGNLLFTCMAEEAVFRGFVQGSLQRLWAGRAYGGWLALAVAAGLFGIAHAGGGAAYVALATVAGFGYGWVYQRTGAIEASILTHFALNAVHFFFFTYPAQQ
jgi:uncharacterized protein